MFTLIWKENGVVRAEYCHLKLQKKLQILRKQITKQEAIQTSFQGPFIESRTHYVMKWENSGNIFQIQVQRSECFRTQRKNSVYHGLLTIMWYRVSQTLIQYYSKWEGGKKFMTEKKESQNKRPK